MTRVTITYKCGCEITPYVDVEDDMVHEYDVNVLICDKHSAEALERAKKGNTVHTPTPFDSVLRRLDGTHP